MNKYTVAVARFPGSGSERMECVAWLIRTVRALDGDGRIGRVVSLCYSDTPVTMLRNRAVQDARRAGADYLLMVDSDMAPDLRFTGAAPFWDAAWEFLMQRRAREHGYEVDATVATPDRLLASGVVPATVAAPYCGPPPDECCYVFQWASRETGTPNPNWRLEMIPRESAAIRSGIQEVAALPTGLILYDMRVFDVLPPPWFRYEYEDDVESLKVTTEDVYQTRNASLLGLPQYCAWDSWAGHCKVKVVGKPSIVTRDEVHESLVEAVLRGVVRQDRLVVLPRKETIDDDRRI